MILNSVRSLESWFRYDYGDDGEVGIKDNVDDGFRVFVGHQEIGCQSQHVEDPLSHDNRF